MLSELASHIVFNRFISSSWSYNAWFSALCSSIYLLFSDISLYTSSSCFFTRFSSSYAFSAIILWGLSWASRIVEVCLKVNCASGFAVYGHSNLVGVSFELGVGLFLLSHSDKSVWSTPLESGLVLLGSSYIYLSIVLRSHISLK